MKTVLSFCVGFCVFVSASLCSVQPAAAASGDLDPAFGSNGIVAFNGGRAIHTPTGVLGQADGKYLVSFTAPVAAGSIGGAPGANEAFGGGVARFNADHTLDTTWGSEGIAGVGLSVMGLATSGTHLLSIEYGRSNEIPGGAHSVVARYTPTGVRDLTFGAGFGQTAQLNIASTRDRFTAVSVAPDGKIVVVGSSDGEILIARFLSNGQPDTSFGAAATGWVRLQIGVNAKSVAHTVAVQGDGKIVFAGSLVLPQRAYIARLTAAGTFDSSFAIGGVYQFSAIDDPSECRGLVAEPLRIVAACSVEFSGNIDLAIFGLTLLGADDLAFEPAIFELGGATGKLMSMFRHPNGRYFAVARGGAANNQLVVVGTESNGLPASGFGTNGKFTAPETDMADGATLGWNGNQFIVASRRNLPVNDDLVLTALSAGGSRASIVNTALSFSHAQYWRPKVLPDGRILAIGNVSSWGLGAFRVSRFLANGTLDISFSGVGHTSFVTGDDWAWGVRDFAVQADGNIAVTGGFGAFNTDNEQTLGVARVLKDGGLDPSFNPGANAGQSTFVLPGTIFLNTGRAVREQADGKLLLASRYSALGTSFQMLAVRFNTDGSRDTTYGVNGLARSAFASGVNARAMDLDAAGRAVLFGDASNQLRFTRFTTAGALDTTFGTGGMASHAVPSDVSLVFSAGIGFVLPDGKLLAVINSASRGNDGVVGLARLNADGTLDSAFGSNGFSFLTVAAGSPSGSAVLHAAIAPNGRIVLVGSGTKGSAAIVPMIARFLPNGRVDADFGEGGVRHYPELSQSVMLGVAFAMDGAMVITGSTGANGRIVPNLFKTVPDGNATGPNLVNAYSRKSHAGYGAPFDVVLDPIPGIDGPITTEPRAQGTGHVMVFRFDVPVTSVVSAALERGGIAGSSALVPVFSNNEVIVQLPMLENLSRARVLLSGVNGQTHTSVSAGFMYGDVTRNGRINAADVIAAKQRKGQSLGIRDNFAFDLNLAGTIDDVDLLQIKQRAGTRVP